LLEVVWVLRKEFGATPEEVARVIEHLLAIDSVEVQNEQQVYEAAIAVQRGRGVFRDALLGALGSWAECDSTLTFDNRPRLAQFEVVDSHRGESE
jgi:predicted nucleic-acid-binding protein